MRHILLPFAIAAGTRSVVDAAASARLVALVGRALRATPGLLCASSSAIDLGTIAAAAVDTAADCPARQKSCRFARLSGHPASSARFIRILAAIHNPATPAV